MEYTLFSLLPSVTLSEIYTELSEEQIGGLLDHLIGTLLQLQKHQWPLIGGLRSTEQVGIVTAQVVDETFWQTANVETLWSPDRTVTSLNIQGLYVSYGEFVSAQC